MYKTTISLHDCNGQRKYLNQSERIRFFEVTKRRNTCTKLFCQLLYYTGARIAEIHNLTTTSIDIANGTVILETLKKRQRGIFREIPLPDHLLKDLDVYIGKLEFTNEETQPLWQFSLRTASRYIKAVMKEANITGTKGCARGLRHGFAVNAVDKAPITLVKKWLGHAALETTEIYLNVIGEEEREIAQRVWLSTKERTVQMPCAYTQIHT